MYAAEDCTLLVVHFRAFECIFNGVCRVSAELLASYLRTAVQSLVRSGTCANPAPVYWLGWGSSSRITLYKAVYLL